MARYRRNKISSGFAHTESFITGTAWRVAAFFFTLLFTSPGFSAQGPPKAPEEPWHITADQLSFDDTKNLYIAEGDVVISRLDRKLTADFVRFDRSTMKALAEGNVIMTAGGDVLIGERMDMNLENETGTVYNGKIFIKATHFYLSGTTLKKTGEKTYNAEEAVITTCDGDSPDWKITGKKLNVVVEGFGTIRHAALWAKKIPVAYTPYLAFPVNRKRQTGLLTPEIGTSDRKGFEYNQPFFWAINDQSDATFYLHHMSKRGEKFGMEYRYLLNEDFRGGIMFDYLDDKKVEDGTPLTTEEWGYAASTGERTNDDRYWFRMKHDQRLPLGIDLALDLDIVSDADYLRDFKGGYAGYKESDAFFEKMFGRGLDDNDDTTRVNRLNLNRKWDRFNLNSEVRWYDNVVYRKQYDDVNYGLWKEAEPPLHKLPSVELFGIRQEIAGTPLFFDLDSEFTYFHREELPENQSRGLRVDIYPRVYLPLSYKNLFTFEPSMGYRQTFWDLSETTDINQDESLSRGIYDIRLDLSTDLERIFDMDRWGVRKLRHSVKPAVVYEYIPEQGQDEYPTFDDLDLIERKNTVTYSITNTLTTRSGIDAPSEGSFTGKDLTGVPAASYRQIGRFKISQTYDFNEANENDPSKWRDGKERRPFMPIEMELEFSPAAPISFLADAAWSTHDNRMVSHNVGAIVTDSRGDSLHIEHRYNDDPEREGIENTETETTESIYLKANLAISTALSLYSEYERNLETETDILTRFGLVYRRQCWAVDLNYTDEDDDQRVAFLVNLSGLGGLGSDLPSLF